ncbi:hypothetical protein ACJJTC_016687 [Scirpophaga incertulas]
MEKNFAIILISLAIIISCQAKVFQRCELVTELRKQGFPENQLRDWVCLVENESSRNTAAKSRKNKDGSYDFGLFQINSRYWCSLTNTPGKGCKIVCNDMLKDDITKASACAKAVYKELGFSAWNAWKEDCKNKPLPDISVCK